MSGEVERRLASHGILLPTPNTPAANYVPLDDAGQRIVGRLGVDVTVEEGQQHARRCAASIIGHLRNALNGDLDRVTRILKLGVFVNATAEFTQHPLVANGASELFVLAFGEAGRHARSAVGVQSLPGGVPVEVDAIVEVSRV